MTEDYVVDSHGIRLAVRDYGGSGVPIVLVHGHAGNLAEYDTIGPLLAERMRVVAYDQRGQGWSESGPISLEHIAADLGSVISASELDRPVLFGSSFGTLVCLAYVLAGGRTRGIVSQDGPAANFEPSSPPAPTPGPTILTAERWEAYASVFAMAGSDGARTALRARVRRADGTSEVRPSKETAFLKERAFESLKVTDGFQAAGAPVLMLASKRPNRPLEERERELTDLGQSVDLSVRWFDAGHWISAADPTGVVTAVLEFAAHLE